MNGIFYDPGTRRLRTVRNGPADAAWTLVTHDLNAGAHRCRRILRELLPCEELLRVDFSRGEARRSA